MKKIITSLKNRFAAPPPPPIDLHGFDYTVKELVGMWENSQIATRWHGQILNDDILQYKTSDTIFILGSGPSINEISAKDWDHIRKHDSIGFNFWFVHDFVPSLYMFQGAGEKMLEVLKDRYFKYKNTPFFIRGSAFARGGFNYNDSRLNLLKNNPVYYLNEYPIHSRCGIDINLLFKYAEALGLMPFGHIADFVPKWRGTLGLLISLAYQMGYKKIILCGMDMQANDHFWDYEPYVDLRTKYSLPVEGKTKIYTFTDKARSPNTVPRYVYGLRDWMYDKNRVEMFVINEKTVLYPEMKVYKN